MDYDEWFELHRHHLYEIYQHIIIPARNKVKQPSEINFKTFCYQAYYGSRVD